MIARRTFCMRVLAAATGAAAFAVTGCSNGDSRTSSSAATSPATPSTTSTSIAVLAGVDVQVHRDPG